MLQITSGWESKRAFPLCVSAQPPAQRRPRQVIHSRSPPQLKHHADYDSVVSLKKPTSCREYFTKSNIKAIAVGRPLCRSMYVTGEVHIGCIFLCILAPYNAEKLEDTRVLLRENFKRNSLLDSLSLPVLHLSQQHSCPCLFEMLRLCIE